MTENSALPVGQENTLFSIKFIIPYFGSWPFWMPFFLKSCALNSTIEWLIYTDCEQPPKVPDNVTFRSISYIDYCRLVSDKLGILFQPPNPYKLCDLKPALGFIHAEDLVGFDFWAFGDIDVIYGDLRGYFNTERLQKKYLLSTHTRRVSGHLCLLKNNELMRTAFKKIPDWSQRLSDQEHHALDEGAFSRLFMGHKNWPDWLRHLAEKFKKESRLSEFVEAHSTFTLWPDGTKTIPDYWEWTDGRLTNSDLKDVSLPYFHFMVWKQTSWINQEEKNLVSPLALYDESSWRISSVGWRHVNTVKL